MKGGIEASKNITMRTIRNEPSVYNIVSFVWWWVCGWETDIKKITMRTIGLPRRHPKTSHKASGFGR